MTESYIYTTSRYVDANKIKRLVKQMHMDYLDLAQASGLSTAFIMRLKPGGHICMRGWMIHSLAKALGVEEDDILWE